jgi:hypothetical protein
VLWDDILEYSSEFRYAKSFLDEIIYSLTGQSIETLPIATHNPKGKTFFAGDDTAQFNISSEGSFELTIYIIEDMIRIDILDFSEIIEYTIQDIKNNRDDIIKEIEDILCAKLKIINKCGYNKLIFYQDNHIKREYKYFGGLLSLISFLCPPIITTYKSLLTCRGK